jgi:hypothetical protein
MNDYLRQRFVSERGGSPRTWFFLPARPVAEAFLLNRSGVSRNRLAFAIDRETGDFGFHHRDVHRLAIPFRIPLCKMTACCGWSEKSLPAIREQFSLLSASRQLNNSRNFRNIRTCFLSGESECPMKRGDE